MHIRILPDLQKLFFDRLEWLKTCFDAFSHTSRRPESCPQKRYFLTSGEVKNVFWCINTYSQTTRKMFWKQIIWPSGGVKSCFDAFSIPDHQKLFLKKDIFERSEWLKTCFDAFAHTSRPPERFFQERYF